jgi:hypothetical protein|tara:strand:+ start:2382 stop:2939 length:558 start_codon:yes stop_codon:yes gene_type:complete
MSLNLQCAPGALGMQDCDIVLPDGSRQEVIKWDDSGNAITKAPSTSPWMAWVPQLWSLNQQGQQYAPFGPAGIPYTMSGMVNWQGKGSNFDNMGWADPNARNYLQSIPGSGARAAYNSRVCDPLWPTFGCRTGGVTTAPTEEEEESWWSKIFGAEDPTTSKMLAPAAIAVGVMGLGYAVMKKSSN